VTTVSFLLAVYDTYGRLGGQSAGASANGHLEVHAGYANDAVGWETPRALFLQSQALAAASLTFIQVQTLQTPAGYRVLLKDCQLHQQGRCVLYWRT
jgi:hypothetical protein